MKVFLNCSSQYVHPQKIVFHVVYELKICIKRRGKPSKMNRYTGMNDGPEGNEEITSILRGR